MTWTGSRRTILAWLGLAPVAIAVAKIAPAEAIGSLDTAYTPTRVRVWKTVLEPDGSSSFVKDGKRYLDEWVKTQKPETWPTVGPCNYVFPDGHVEVGTLAPSLDDIKTTIQWDADDVKERSNPWRELEENEEKLGVSFGKVDCAIYRDGPPLKNPWRRGVVLREDNYPILDWGS